jgi:hypothetical protein
LTGISLCDGCSCHEILRAQRTRVDARAAAAAARDVEAWGLLPSAGGGGGGDGGGGTIGTDDQSAADTASAAGIPGDAGEPEGCDDDQPQPQPAPRGGASDLLRTAVADAAAAADAAPTSPSQQLQSRRRKWRREFRRRYPLSWCCQVLALPMVPLPTAPQPGASHGGRGAGQSVSINSVTELVSGRAVLYLQMLSSLAWLLGALCVLGGGVVIPTLASGGGCINSAPPMATATAPGAGVGPPPPPRTLVHPQEPAELLCLLSFANIQPGDAVRLWVVTLCTVAFSALTWLQSTRQIRRAPLLRPGGQCDKCLRRRCYRSPLLPRACRDRLQNKAVERRKADSTQIGAPHYSLMIRHIRPHRGGLIKVRSGGSAINITRAPAAAQSDSSAIEAERDLDVSVETGTADSTQNGAAEQGQGLPGRLETQALRQRSVIKRRAEILAAATGREPPPRTPSHAGGVAGAAELGQDWLAPESGVRVDEAGLMRADDERSCYRHLSPAQMDHSVEVGDDGAAGWVIKRMVRRPWRPFRRPF